MKNSLEVSSDEKKRIRDLHLLSEQENINIDIDEPLASDDIIKTDVSIVEPGDDGFESSVLPASYHVWRWCHHGGPRVIYAGQWQQNIQGTQLQQESTAFYMAMGSPSVGEIIHITHVPGLIQRRMCYEYLGFQIRTTALDNSATPFPTTTAVRDPGSWSTCQDCEQASTGPQGYCVDCVNGQMTYYPGPQGQQWTSCPQGYSDIGPTPNPPGGGPCTECQNGNCTNVGWGYGPNHFNSMSECQNATGPQACIPPTGWECVNNACIQTPAGQFSTQAICQAQTNCGVTYPKYKCTGGANGCVQHNNGTFTGPTALADCETACCQNSLNSWNWNALPNPTCQQLNAKFNTGAIQAIGDCNGNTTPGPHNFSHKCRYDWMVAQAAAGNCCGSISSVCCDNPGYLSASLNPVPGPNSGKCLKQGFINNKEAGYQQFGCSWLQNVMNNLNTNIANTTSNAVLCSLHGRKAWLTTFMNGGNAYNSTITVNPPC